MTFNDLDIIAPILQVLNSKGYKTPTSIQQQSIPEILLWRNLLGIAQTGVGKTAAFAVPILHYLVAVKR